MFYMHTILHANVNLRRAVKPFLIKVDKFENNKTKLKKPFLEFSSFFFFLTKKTRFINQVVRIAVNNNYFDVALRFRT